MEKLSEKSLKTSINQSRKSLVRDLHQNNIIDGLTQNNILTVYEREEVRAITNEHEKNRKLIDFLEKKNAGKILQFLKVLGEQYYPEIAITIKLRACLLDCSTEIKSIDDEVFQKLLQKLLEGNSEDDRTEMRENPSDKLERLEEIVTLSEDNFVEFMQTLRETEINIQEPQPKPLSRLAEKLGELSGLDEFKTGEKQLSGNSPVPTTTVKVIERFSNVPHIKKTLDLSFLCQADEIMNEMQETIKQLRRNEKGNYITRDSIRPPYLILISEFYHQNSLLQHLSEKGGPFNETTVRTWIQWIASSLYDLHRVLHFHGNLKPSNIIIESGSAKLIDVGIKSLLLNKQCHQSIARCNTCMPYFVTPFLVTPIL